MDEHTPGPWVYGIRDDGSIWMGMGDPVKGPHHAGDFFGPSADAALIAAAPDLLEELRNIVKADYRAWEYPANNAEDFVAWAKSRARFAIAKYEECRRG